MKWIICRVNNLKFRHKIYVTLVIVMVAMTTVMGISLYYNRQTTQHFQTMLAYTAQPTSRFLVKQITALEADQRQRIWGMMVVTSISLILVSGWLLLWYRQDGRLLSILVRQATRLAALTAPAQT